MSQTLIFREESLFDPRQIRNLFKQLSFENVFESFKNLLSGINLELDEQERDALLVEVELKLLDQAISFNEKEIQPKLETSDYMIPNSKIYMVSPPLWEALEKIIRQKIAMAVDAQEREEIIKDLSTLERLYEQKRLFVDVV